MRILFRRDGDPAKQKRKDKLMSFVQIESSAKYDDGTITINATYEDWILIVDDLKTGAQVLEDELDRIEQEIADPDVESRGTVEANAPFVKAIRETIAKRFERAEAISKLAEEEETIE